MSEGTAASNTLTWNIKPIIKQNARNMIEINKKKKHYYFTSEKIKTQLGEYDEYGRWSRGKGKLKRSVCEK